MKKSIKLFTVVLILVMGNQILSQQVFIPKGAVWKYLDDGSDQGTAWKEVDFNDSSWASGPAQLGYSEGDEATLISYGLDPNNKYIATYFRHSFTVNDSSNVFNLVVNLLRDDGGVVYLNGTEVVRSNMPAGTITYRTKAASTVGGSTEDTFFEYYIDPSLLQPETNVIAVEIHQSSGTSSDISFDLELKAATSAPSSMRKAPYLIYRGNNTEYQILWQLNKTMECKLEWGTNIFYADGNVTTTEYGTDHQHAYIFQDLTPRTKYYYRVTVDSSEYKGAFYSAPDENIDSLKFLVYGDNRSYPEKHNLVAKQIIDLYTSDPGYHSIIMNVGDMVSNGESEEDWDTQFFDPAYTSIQELFGSMGLQAARGNHEGNGILFKKYYPYPYVSNFYWSFDYGPAHFTIIDQYSTYSTGSAQYNWIKNDLETSNKRWKFIILHAPGWSAGGHSNSSNVQNYIQPLCEQNNVQIVFGGHNHYYARAVVNGITHITTGGGGAPLYDADPNYPNIVVTSKTNHFCRINITGENLDFKAINSSGNEIDAFKVTLTGVEENTSEQLPTHFSLEQNYPNPFNPSTVISFNIPEDGFVNLTIYDLLGKRIKELVNEYRKAGRYEEYFWSNNLASGIYVYQVIFEGTSIETDKMILLK
ncbi:hypothetical protein MNBD_IGNAVI01-1824 [hydrothermal vent metagenome]|uniref:Uncharacterized protein n=1 Tax=hydrothermal vent metagenome TaxID=652676 RepID=A0A3B1CL16_9ZZZZ